MYLATPQAQSQQHSRNIKKELQQRKTLQMQRQLMQRELKLQELRRRNGTSPVAVRQVSFCFLCWCWESSICPVFFFHKSAYWLTRDRRHRHRPLYQRRDRNPRRNDLRPSLPTAETPGPVWRAKHPLTAKMPSRTTETATALPGQECKSRSRWTFPETCVP